MCSCRVISVHMRTKIQVSPISSLHFLQSFVLHREGFHVSGSVTQKRCLVSDFEALLAVDLRRSPSFLGCPNEGSLSEIWSPLAEQRLHANCVFVSSIGSLPDIRCTGIVGSSLCPDLWITVTHWLVLGGILLFQRPSSGKSHLFIAGVRSLIMKLKLCFLNLSARMIFWVRSWPIPTVFLLYILTLIHSVRLPHSSALTWCSFSYSMSLSIRLMLRFLVFRGIDALVSRSESRSQSELYHLRDELIVKECGSWIEIKWNSYSCRVQFNVICINLIQIVWKTVGVRNSSPNP
jgi:hypothetical protein